MNTPPTETRHEQTPRARLTDAQRAVPQRARRGRRLGSAVRARACMFGLALLIALAPATRVSAGNVVVLLSADVEQYQKAVEGFRKSTTHTIVATYDMRGDFDRGRDLLKQIEANDKPDLIYAVGIWALQLVAQQQPRTPVVYSMVLNPPSILSAAQDKNVTGASMNVAAEQTFQLLKQLNPSLKRIGTIYNEKTTGFLITDAKAAAKKMDLELVAKEIESPRDAIRAIDELQKEKIDALWIVPDRHVLAPAVTEQMLLFSYRQRIPLVGLSKRHVEMGSVLSLSFGSSEDIGRQAGELAGNILAGKSAGDLPFTSARKVELIINLKTAAKLGIDVPEGMLKQATEVIR